MWRDVLRSQSSPSLIGQLDGTLADVPQRKVLTLTDAIVCGEGEGPLGSHSTAPLGMLTLASNPVAADYVHAHLMGFDWRKVHLIREAFASFRYPLCSVLPEDIELHFNGKRLRQPWSFSIERPGSCHRWVGKGIVSGNKDRRREAFKDDRNT